MSCEHLICAQCAGPVIEARCPACQAARADVHRNIRGFSLPYALLVLLLALAILIAIQHVGR
jgi:hypothetical protein